MILFACGWTKVMELAGDGKALCETLSLMFPCPSWFDTPGLSASVFGAYEVLDLSGKAFA
jgi:hypothetical protein